MSDIAIRVDHLSKRYTIGHQTAGKARSIREALTQTARSLTTFANGQARIPQDTTEEFWALKDISFEVKRGERIGIIGRNGAGKSTLLKILSRVTEPTSGRIQINGRVASLLEVGTGFHPELTGRENIFLNGAILGMSRGEIQRKFDEIVEFAEIEKFLDTPVKRYSSGMYVRLAFAVAAHLEPEILIVDEVLAVGDVQFQKKCLGKMEDVAEKSSRTVLFVSHQMGAVEKLCTRGIVLAGGESKFDGSVKSAIDCYLQALNSGVSEYKSLLDLPRSGTGEILISNFFVQNSQGMRVSSVASGDSVTFVFEYVRHGQKALEDTSIGMSIHNSLGEIISVLYSDYMGKLFNIKNASGRFTCTIDNFPYSKGRYFIGARIMNRGIEVDWIKGFIGFIDVEAGDFYKTGTIYHSGIGSVLIKGDWQVNS